MDNFIKNLSKEIGSRSIQEAEYFPVDRAFLEPYLERISSVKAEDFILCNIEMVNPTYTNLLFLCLPEIWEEIEANELIELMDSFTNVFSYFTLIEFSYKYLEINILHIIMESAKKHGLFDELKNYLVLQWNVILKTQNEIFELENGFEHDVYAYDPIRWRDIKSKFLMDERILPAIYDPLYLNNYIRSL